jgi:hypothetical protein
MKKLDHSPVTKIRKLDYRHFLLVTILIFVLPVVKEWRLLLTGTRVEGTVTGIQQKVSGDETLLRSVEFRAIIEYEFGGQKQILPGPENLRYKTGRKVPLILQPGNEDEIIIATLSGFYVQKRSIALIIVLILWIAIYTTLRQAQLGTFNK